MENQQILEKLAFNVVQGRVEAEDEGFDPGLEGQPGVTEMLNLALENKIDPKEIILEGLTRPMEEVGKKFEKEEYLIPDMLASAECVGIAMDILAPHLMVAGVQSKGTFVIATMQGDLHDIGKSIVAIMVKGAGYDVVDLGTDVSANRIVESVKEKGASFVGLSALLTTTMWVMGDVIQQLKQEGLREKVVVLIGGAPTSEEFAKEIGVDAYCKDAFQAIEVLKKPRAA
jgi:5-methyltetrahydrofolate--homocysteine methyltransferase